MSHGNILATVSGVLSIVPEIGVKDTYLAYLPLAHILELVAEVGARIALDLSLVTLCTQSAR